MFRSSPLLFAALIGCVLSCAGCAGQRADASLVSPTAVHWEGQQLLVEGTGFPAGAKGQLCLDGRWQRLGSSATRSLSRCVEAWAHADSQVVSGWPSQGAFEGSLSLRFEGRVANLRGSLEDVAFVAGPGGRIESSPGAERAWTATTTTLASWVGLLLFALAILRTRVGAGLFVVGQALGNNPSVSARPLLITAFVCAALALLELRQHTGSQWLALMTICLHPNLMSWLRGHQTQGRSFRALVMWSGLALGIALTSRAGGNWPSATQLVLLSLGLSALSAGHAWIVRRRITDDIGLGVGAWFIAQAVVGASPLAVVVALFVAWTALRTAPLFHWTAPSLVPCALGLATIGGLELLAWMEPISQATSPAISLLMLGTCVARVLVDMHGPARQLSPIGAPDQTLPDLTLA